MSHYEDTPGRATATDTGPVVLLTICHCWQRDRDRDGAPVYVTGRFAMLAAEVALIDSPDCCRVTRELAPGITDPDTAALLFGHIDGCEWLNGLLDLNADVLAVAA